MCRWQKAKPQVHSNTHADTFRLKRKFFSATADRARQFVSRCRWRLQFGNILKSFLMKSFRGGGSGGEKTFSPCRSVVNRIRTQNRNARCGSLRLGIQIKMKTKPTQEGWLKILHSGMCRNLVQEKLKSKIKISFSYSNDDDAITSDSCVASATECESRPAWLNSNSEKLWADQRARFALVIVSLASRDTTTSAFIVRETRKKSLRREKMFDVAAPTIVLRWRWEGKSVCRELLAPKLTFVTTKAVKKALPRAEAAWHWKVLAARKAAVIAASENFSHSFEISSRRITNGNSNYWKFSPSLMWSSYETDDSTSDKVLSLKKSLNLKKKLKLLNKYFAAIELGVVSERKAWKKKLCGAFKVPSELFHVCGFSKPPLLRLSKGLLGSAQKLLMSTPSSWWGSCREQKPLREEQLLSSSNQFSLKIIINSLTQREAQIKRSVGMS